MEATQISNYGKTDQVAVVYMNNEWNTEQINSKNKIINFAATSMAQERDRK